MALVQKVKGIIAQAEKISEMGLFQRPAAYEELVKNEIVPVLLAVAEHIDGFNEPMPDDVEQVSVAEVLNEFQDKIGDMKKDLEFACKQANDAKVENEKMQQEITTLKGRVTKLQKSSTGAVA